MPDINMQLLFIFELVVFLTSVLMHIMRRNDSLISIYYLQSLSIVGLLLTLGYLESSSLIIVGLITFFIKLIFTPIFFNKLISQKNLPTTATTYLNLPITLGITLGITIFVKSSIVAPIIALVPQNGSLIALALSGMLISLFLVINRRGVFSQLIGILSFENGLVAFSLLAGLEQTLAIEVGILFDIAVWMLISTVLVNMVYRHFNTLDAKEMSTLKD